MATYTKDGQISTGNVLYLEDKTIINPTEAQMIEAGWTKVVPPTPTAEEIAQQQRDARIWELKDLLAQGDYKIIKCVEAQLTDNALPYDIEQLVAERNAYRAEINELEAM